MTQRTEIEVTISAQGQVEVRVAGVKGEGCLEYEQLLVQLLGRELERELTGEYYEQPARVRRSLWQRVRARVKG